ncbi:SpoIIIAH-like family protein [Tissierella creatinophila]|uniref:Stage III sporulation protein AH n=1 Tax=Tissierella creatinophila DSM 6911 TaxID=1123403 RepID=A0A1U7M9Q3_TISCR|nr:SpoIIIAH-like family protein [Tissierella creatinophila]OLS03939.1 stage III sporulation protein AH [Tissierella creatinophila DSM 6911]
MFKIKRPAIIGLLLVLLVFTGYLNYELTQQALKKTSAEYKKHELSEKVDYKKSDMLADKNKEKDFEIVDSEESNNTNNPLESVDKDTTSNTDNIKEVVNTNKETVDKIINKEVSANSRNYFIEYKLSRDKLRASLVDRLDTIVKNDKTDSKIRSEAQNEIITIGKISEKELKIEGLIKAKGFEEVLVVLTEEDVKVIVSIDDLSEQDMVKILDIVKEETKFDINNIKIIKKQ